MKNTTTRRRIDVGVITLHTKTRETGATVTTERVGPGSWLEQEPGWMTLCLDHGACLFHRTRGLAELHHRQPSGWCPDCRRIVEGKRPKITTPKIR